MKAALSRHKRRPLVGGEKTAVERLDDLDEMVDFSYHKNDERIIPIQLPVDALRRANCTNEGAAKDDNDSCDGNHIDIKAGGDSLASPCQRPDDIHRQCNCFAGPLYGLESFKGFLYAPQALTASLQMHLAHQAVSVYCESPHVTNIDSVEPRPGEDIIRESSERVSMWELWKVDRGLVRLEKEKKTQGVSRPSASLPSSHRSFRKLSWATMGYHYDWTARAYHENAKSPMPHALQSLGRIFARTSMIFENEDRRSSSCSEESPESSSIFMESDFNATACIVNYYNPKSVMGGHRDDLEYARDKPIVSLSIGRPAVFLLGGHAKDETPVVPILVRPGDVMIMGGESRLRYHAMARLLPQDLPTKREQNNKEEWHHVKNIEHGSISVSDLGVGDGSGLYHCDPDDQKALALFCSEHRININLRQVYSSHSP